MAKATNRIVVDVTQLVHWGGKLTGIPRVMHELAVRCRREHQDARFVSWVKEIQDFCEIDLDATLKQRGNGIVYLYGPEPAHAGDTPAAAEAGEAGAAAGDVPAEKAPAPEADTASAMVKRGLKRVAKAAIRRTRYIHPRIAETLESKAKAAHMSRFRRMQFRPGDVLFIPWGEWWDKNFLARLEQLHADGIGLSTIIHDIGPMVVPHLSGHSTESLAEYCERIVPIADLVLAVSQNTKKDLTEWLKARQLPVPKIEVFRLGDNFEVVKPERPADEGFARLSLKGNDYIMCVGTIEAKKNHTLFFYVYSLARSRGVDLPPLLIVGRRGWKTENIFDIISDDPALKDKIVFMTDVSDAELSWLYDHCMFTVLPSFYEGWGIPIAESVARGVPCLHSNTTSMVEIAPGITGHFNPASAEECLAAIEQWLKPKALEKARLQTKKYKPTSWDDSFKQADGFLQQIGKGK